MLQQERAEALDLVVDAILAERPPIDAGVDRKHRLVEPERAVDLTGTVRAASITSRSGLSVSLIGAINLPTASADFATIGYRSDRVGSSV